MMPSSGTPPASCAPPASQVVRLVRRQRAKLPQRDLMGEAYLVVLAQLVGDAEANRERLEDTAIPDLDDGLTNARAALLVEAHAAMDEMAETVAADLRAFNQDLPVDIRPAMRGLPAVTERAAALVVGPADFHVGRFEEWDCPSWLCSSRCDEIVSQVVLVATSTTFVFQSPPSGRTQCHR